jgi:hypothetical protein
MKWMRNLFLHLREVKATIWKYYKAYRERKRIRNTKMNIYLKAHPEVNAFLEQKKSIIEKK